MNPYTNADASVLTASPLERGVGVLLDTVWGTVLDAVAGVTGIDMLGFPFMQRAYLAAICIAVIGPLVGAFLVHREMAMIADTLAHSAFAGVAAGLFVNAVYAVAVPPLLSALVVAAVAALLVQTLVDYAGAYRDTSLAIVLTGAFAIGSVLITATGGGIAVGINAYLFGSLATVSRLNAALLVALSAGVTVGIALAYRPLVYITFDEIGARASGIGVKRYNQLLAVLTAVVVIGAMQIMGVILVAAMLVVPVAAAAQVARGFREALLASVVLAQIAVLLGITLSYRYETTAGGTIVLVAVGVYIGMVIAGRLQSRRSVVEDTGAVTGGIEADAEESPGD